MIDGTESGSEAEPGEVVKFLEQEIRRMPYGKLEMARKSSGGRMRPFSIRSSETGVELRERYRRMNCDGTSDLP